MSIIFDTFNAIFYAPIVNLLIFVLRVFEASHIPGAMGLTIIALTILIRVALWPLMSAQMKSAKKMADLKPFMDELKKKHKDDKPSLAAAQMALYKEHGVNPAGGCLPVLLQIPILIALYNAVLALFNSAHLNDGINKFLYVKEWALQSPPDPYFLGINLANRPSDFLTAGLLLLLIPLITAGLQFLQSKMMLAKPVKQYPSDSPKEKKEKESMEDTMASVQSQMMYMMPVVIGFVSWQFPIGLAIYWNTFTLLGIIQQYRVAGWGGLESWIERLKLSR